MTYPLFIPVHPSEVSDGYHTFSELYDHRTALWLNLLQVHVDTAFKTRLDDEGSEMDGWFITGINTKFGQITYHLPNEYWSKLKIREVDCNSDYDGHSSEDVLQRLLQLCQDSQ